MSTINRIIELTKQRGLKQTYVCAQLGLEKTWMQTARKQNSNISDERLNKIAEILDTTTAYLKGETDNPEKEKSPSNDGLAPDEQAILNMYRMTPPEKRLDFIRQLITLVPDDQHNDLASFVLEAIKTSI